MNGYRGLNTDFSDAEQPALSLIQQLIDRHFAIWNDPDSVGRASAYAALYHDDVLIADYAGKAVGHDALGRKIDEVQAKHPLFRFTPDAPVWNHGVGRVTWAYGPVDNPQQVRGEDIFTVIDEKIASLRIFIDRR